MGDFRLSSRHILIVEDEYLLAMELQRELEGCGAVVVGPVPSVGRAARLIANEPRIDLAVLDVNLDGEMVFPVADMLAERAIPFFFLTGYENGIIQSRYPDIARCVKPVEFSKLYGALRALL